MSLNVAPSILLPHIPSTGVNRYNNVNFLVRLNEDLVSAIQETTLEQDVPKLIVKNGRLSFRIKGKVLEANVLRDNLKTELYSSSEDERFINMGTLDYKINMAKSSIAQCPQQPHKSLLKTSASSHSRSHPFLLTPSSAPASPSPSSSSFSSSVHSDAQHLIQQFLLKGNSLTKEEVGTLISKSKVPKAALRRMISKVHDVNYVVRDFYLLQVNCQLLGAMQRHTIRQYLSSKLDQIGYPENHPLKLKIMHALPDFKFIKKKKIQSPKSTASPIASTSKAENNSPSPSSSASSDGLKKRKMDNMSPITSSEDDVKKTKTTRTPIPKTVDPELLQLAINFKAKYPEYEKLYKSLSKPNFDPNHDKNWEQKLTKLVKMHNQLSAWKAKLWEEEDNIRAKSSGKVYIKEK
ncbi:BA75_00041T0 [Komagataella pastoris]|uniref:BA75_00041T0 n=1 Tax=Komagataella pastoris TaxID=4922 RepID=A0A1B2J8R7_PICPA|nr:BA75_00041T0 [Komagataella pastoris]